MGLRIEAQAKTSTRARTRVVLIRDKDAVDSSGHINTEVIRRMLDTGVVALLGVRDHAQAWGLLVKPADVVGIKSNEWGPLPTPVEVERAIRRRIMDTGVPEKKIGVADRGVLKSRIFLGSTALVNVRPLRTHHWAGIGGCIKNYIMFTARPSDYHPDSCANLAAIWNLPLVEGKTRLNVLVLLEPLFYGIGPHHFSKSYTWQYRGILTGTNPVSVDTVGLHILQAKRASFFGENRPITPPPKHVFIADTRYKLGASDMHQIELVKLGWMDEILI
jgi:hypothetical protein